LLVIVHLKVVLVEHTSDFWIVPISAYFELLRCLQKWGLRDQGTWLILTITGGPSSNVGCNTFWLRRPECYFCFLYLPIFILWSNGPTRQISKFTFWKAACSAYFKHVLPKKSQAILMEGPAGVRQILNLCFW
jgi:hypothetical protein